MELSISELIENKSFENVFIRFKTFVQEFKFSEKE